MTTFLVSVNKTISLTKIENINLFTSPSPCRKWKFKLKYDVFKKISKRKEDVKILKQLQSLIDDSKSIRIS